MSVNTLYRFFDHEGRLLYVGRTIDPSHRLRTHQRSKPWWATVARIELEQHRDLEALVQAEVVAITAESPLHNVAHAPFRRRRPKAISGPRPPVCPNVLDAYMTSHETCSVWCSFCERWHTHGAADGHRVAHCLCSASPYQDAGYYIHLVVGKRPRRHQRQEAVCGEGWPCERCPAKRHGLL